MKEWNNPELLSMGLENTFEEVDTISNAQGNLHWCHKMNNGKGGVCDTVHTGNNTPGHTQIDASHHHGDDLALINPDVVNYKKCCCKDYKPPQS